MDKILELIFEEARRRPGKNLGSKVHQVLVEIGLKVIEVMGNIQKSESLSNLASTLKGVDENDTGNE